MNFLRKNWYYVGAAVFVALAVVLAVFWNDISVLRKLMIMSYMAVYNPGVFSVVFVHWPSAFTTSGMS